MNVHELFLEEFHKDIIKYGNMALSEALIEKVVNDTNLDDDFKVESIKILQETTFSKDKIITFLKNDIIKNPMFLYEQDEETVKLYVKAKRLKDKITDKYKSDLQKLKGEAERLKHIINGAREKQANKITFSADYAVMIYNKGKELEEIEKKIVELGREYSFNIKNINKKSPLKKIEVSKEIDKYMDEEKDLRNSLWRKIQEYESDIKRTEKKDVNKSILLGLRNSLERYQRVELQEIDSKISNLVFNYNYDVSTYKWMGKHVDALTSRINDLNLDLQEFKSQIQKDILDTDSKIEYAEARERLAYSKESDQKSPTKSDSQSESGFKVSWSEYLKDIFDRGWYYMTNPRNWGWGLGVGTLIATLILGSYYLYKHFFNKDCSKLDEGPGKIECQVKAINRAISKLIKGKKKCISTINPRECRSELDILIKKWQDRKQELLSI